MPKSPRSFLIQILHFCFHPFLEGEDGKFYMVPVNDLIDPETQIGNYAAIVGLCRWPIEASIGTYVKREKMYICVLTYFHFIFRSLQAMEVPQVSHQFKLLETIRERSCGTVQF